MSARGDAKESTLADLPERFPFEDLDNGLYVHPGTVEVVAITRYGANQENRHKAETTEDYYVPVSDYMAVQKQRDDYRRTLGLVNALHMRDDQTVTNLLREAGFSDADAVVMRALIAEASTWAVR